MLDGFTRITKLLQTVGTFMSSLLVTCVPTFSQQTALFSVALSLLMQHEGGFVNDPIDSGGATKWGISLRFLKIQGYVDGDVDKDGDIDIQDIKNLRTDQREVIYRKGFWDKNRIGEIMSQRLANMYFGMSVNMGNQRATQLLQRAVNVYFQNNPEEKITADGVCGGSTINAINKCMPNSLLRLFQQECEIFYQSLVRQHPQQEKFLKGWLSRLKSY